MPLAQSSGATIFRIESGGEKILKISAPKIPVALY
jgi:hypothetical protein